MSNSPEEFEKLQKLLKVKRHEVPPPGYFNNFSSQVITGIERGNAGGYGAMSQVPWMRRLLSVLETNPFAAGVFGASICGLLVSGLAWSQMRTPSAYATASNTSLAVAENTSATASVAGWGKAANVDSLAPSFTPVLSGNLSAGLFSGGGTVTAETVNFSVAH